jgi:asparagine synthase (glutamine-hydrolysing)
MCGINGYVGNEISEAALTESLRRIAHRGPDGEGMWRDEGVMLGHRRLSIIDLSENAKQPMHVLDRYVLTFNGEIYNYKELRAELEKHNFNFKSNSDTETLLYCYALWGEKCLDKLNGMWAFAIWDRQEKKLFLSRDRVGKKPLFYSYLKNGFTFASEMKGLYPFLERVEINNETLAIARQDNFGYETTEKCLIKNILRFPAGSYGIYENGKLAINKFWHPLEQLVAVPKNYSGQVEMFRELFIDSCRIRMRSDVTIGTALSGGIDSSATICSMSHIAKNNSVSVDWQHAFVATFSGTSLDETEYAKEVTDFLGIKADFTEIDPVKELNEIFHQAYLFEEIYYAPTIPFVQLYRQMKNRGVKVSIDGHGADELFGGYPFDISAAMIDALPDIFSCKQISDTISNCSEPPQKDLLNRFKYALANKYPAAKLFSRNTPLQKKYERLDYFTSRLYESTYLTILPTLLRNYDRYSMMNGVEIRMPFLDYRILQFALSIPGTSKVRGGFTKAIVRDALKGIVPEKILRRKSKIGFNSPMDAWVKRKEFREWLHDEMNSVDFLNSSVIDVAETQKAMNELMGGKTENFMNASKAFKKFIPYIWEKGMKQFAKQ